MSNETQMQNNMGNGCECGDCPECDHRNDIEWAKQVAPSKDGIGCSIPKHEENLDDPAIKLRDELVAIHIDFHNKFCECSITEDHNYANVQCPTCGVKE